MEQNNIDAKNRILNASIQLFSEKGYDATRVNEIAHEANVNKALIYYYFKSKEEILDDLVESLFHNTSSLVMDFVQNNVITMIRDGLLDIEPDRFHFLNQEAMMSFIDKMNAYHAQLLDFLFKNKQLIRIMMLESLKKGKHHNDLFRLLDFFKQSNDNAVYSTIRNADEDFTYSDTGVVFKFFYVTMPMISFVSFYYDYKFISGKSDQELKESLMY